MDLNAEQGHAYFGEYQDRPWISHGRLKRLNIGYLDGSVIERPIDEVILQFPGGAFEELQWFEQAHGFAVWQSEPSGRPFRRGKLGAASPIRTVRGVGYAAEQSVSTT